MSVGDLELYVIIEYKNYWRCYAENKMNPLFRTYKVRRHFHPNKFDSLDLAEQLLEVTVNIHKPNRKIMCAIEEDSRYYK